MEIGCWHLFGCPVEVSLDENGESRENERKDERKERERGGEGLVGTHTHNFGRLSICAQHSWVGCICSRAIASVALLCIMRGVEADSVATLLAQPFAAPFTVVRKGHRTHPTV